MEEYKKELIDRISVECIDVGVNYKCFSVGPIDIGVNHKCISAIPIHNYNDYYSFMDKMTFDEIVTFINGEFKERLGYRASENETTKFVKTINELERQLRHEAKLDKEIAFIKDNLQNTADVINLFTDIEKNRTNTDNRMDKLEQKMDKLESSINQILNMLQKS